ncbi:MAG: tetratricopeptide repeat protein, partial [Pirellulales bacterium]
TASGFAADIERHLHDEPVEAGPPSAAYRFRKFARRNKSALAIAALVLFFLAMLGGSVGWTVRDRSARQARVSGQLELILDEVARLEEAEKWSEALASARRAEPALATGEAPPRIQERVRQTLADLELVRRLDEIRAQSGTIWVNGPTRIPRAAKADQEYAAALRQVGIDVDALPLKETVDRITARRSIAAALLPALDDWVAARSVGNDETATRRLIDVLHAADPDPWRQRMRDALIRKDWPALENLARSTDIDRQPAATLSFLYAALSANAKHLLGIVVLRRAQWKYPADYWINHRLGTNLIWLQLPHHVEEGIGYVRAAVALRPQSEHAVMNLGNGYAFLGQHDDAIACYRKAIELSPHYEACYTNLGIVLSRKGAHDEAIAAFEETIKLRRDYTEAYSELSMIHSNRPDAHHRNARRAAELAKKALEIEPKFSNHWTALGIARYREGQWQEAHAAFDKSLQLGTDFLDGALSWEEAIDWFFLAMCHQQLGQTEEARQYYEKGVVWMEKNHLPNSEQLMRIRAEVEELLKITGEKPTTEPESK